MADKGQSEAPERAGAWEYGTAAALFGLGAYIAAEGFDMGVGSLRRMGPGFVPVAVGGGLACLSLGIAAELRRGGRARFDAPLRPVIFILSGLVAFAATIGTFGLVTATCLLVLTGSFADRAMTPLRAGLSALFLSALGYLVFIRGFGLPLTAFGG